MADSSLFDQFCCSFD